MDGVLYSHKFNQPTRGPGTEHDAGSFVALLIQYEAESYLEQKVIDFAAGVLEASSNRNPNDIAQRGAKTLS